MSLKVSQKYQEVSRATPAFTVYLKYQKVSRATCPLLLFTESIKKYPGPHAHFYYLQKVSKSILGHKPTSAFYFRVIKTTQNSSFTTREVEILQRCQTALKERDILTI